MGKNPSLAWESGAPIGFQNQPQQKHLRSESSCQRPNIGRNLYQGTILIPDWASQLSKSMSTNEVDQEISKPRVVSFSGVAYIAVEQEGRIAD